ncbi:recombination protein NinG [Pseudomonas aeruginosa]
MASACALLPAPLAIKEQTPKPAREGNRRPREARGQGSKEKLKSRSDHLREAQQAFNEFIRWCDRIAGHACISSGLPLDWSGNQTDAGTTGRPEPRRISAFNENNCHAQRKLDNRYLSGNAVDYRVGLIARIGLAAVEELEADNSVRKYTVKTEGHQGPLPRQGARAEEEDRLMQTAISITLA